MESAGSGAGSCTHDDTPPANIQIGELVSLNIHHIE